MRIVRLHDRGELKYHRGHRIISTQNKYYLKQTVQVTVMSTCDHMICY